MDTIDYLNNKKYEIPQNIPTKTTHKYMEVIEKDLCKYIEVIARCDKYILYSQLVDIVVILESYNGKHPYRKASTIINTLKTLGFIKVESIGSRRNIIYLKKPSLAVYHEDYKNSDRVNFKSDLKNNKIVYSSLKAEYFIKFRKFINNNSSLNQLQSLTSELYSAIASTNNTYNYDLNTIIELIKTTDLSSAVNLVNDKSEFNHKLGPVRTLWSGLGSLYLNMIKQRQFVDIDPIFKQIHINDNGEVTLHLIVNIIIFDINHDLKFYKTKKLNLFYSFYEMPNNKLRNMQTTYQDSNHTSLGDIHFNHVGFSITLIGYNQYMLNKKKMILDEDLHSNNPNAALMEETKIIHLDIEKYFVNNHNTSSINEIHEQTIDDLIEESLRRIDDNDNSNIDHYEEDDADKKSKLLNFIKEIQR